MESERFIFSKKKKQTKKNLPLCIVQRFFQHRHAFSQQLNECCSSSADHSKHCSRTLCESGTRHIVFSSNAFPDQTRKRRNAFFGRRNRRKKTCFARIVRGVVALRVAHKHVKRHHNAIATRNLRNTMINRCIPCSPN